MFLQLIFLILQRIFIIIVKQINKMEHSTLTDYNEKVEKNAEEAKNEVFWNDNIVHNVIIMKEMFKHSNEIKMYCGKGSIFRKEFADKVKRKIKEEEKISPDYIDNLYTQINSFLERNGKLTIILEKEDSLSDVAGKIESNMKKGNVFIYKLNDEYRPQFHFSIGDGDKYRREIGAEEHNAFANFHDEGDKIESLEKQFQLLLQYSKSTQINNLKEN